MIHKRWQVRGTHALLPGDVKTRYFWTRWGAARTVRRRAGTMLERRWELVIERRP